MGVRAVDAFAVEPSSDREANTAAFRIWRHGVGDTDLEVNYELGGRATQGEDYERLSGVAVIPAESKFVDVVIQPLADGLKEGLETVVLRLTESSQYELAWSRRAAVVISDAPWAHPARGVRCIRLGDGMVHLCFVAETGRKFRLEGTKNLRDWIHLQELVGVDGAVHYVDAESSVHKVRCFRLVPVLE